MQRRSLDSSSVLSTDDLSEYDIISDGQQSLESSIADLGLADNTNAHSNAPTPIYEPAPVRAAEELFGTPALSADDIQAYTRANSHSNVGVDAGSCSKRQNDLGGASRRTVRVYVDGVFDPFDAGHALQLRQAKLSFPAVRLLVGVFSDELCARYGSPTRTPHLERCELVRHCRWVDEVVPDAPWKIDEAFLSAMRIEFVAIDEGVSINPAYEKERVKGYDLVKGLRKSIPTRRTSGLSRTQPPPSPIPPPSPSPVIPPPSPPLPFPKAEESPMISDGKGTIRRIPPPRVERKELKNGESPFEEPLVDLFD